jgi:hypothetical protein
MIDIRAEKWDTQTPMVPPFRSTVNGGAETLYELAKASITVPYGNVGKGVNNSVLMVSSRAERIFR